MTHGYITKHPRLIIVSFVLALLIVYGNLPHALMMLLMVGAIPGTSISLSPSVMLYSIIAITWFLGMSLTTRHHNH